MPEVAVVVPTLNERGNLTALVEKVDRALIHRDYELIIVDDDSEDDTASYARQLAQSNPRIRIVQRIGRRGLSSAVVEGFLATSAPYLAVMDGDLQHDESVLPQMLAILETGQADLVVGTRNTLGGSVGSFAPHRVALSSLGRSLSRIVCKTELSDPMSGFFVIRRTVFDEVAHNLSLTGFKILVDIIASSDKPIRAGEVPYTFGERQYGESKLDTMVALEYILLLVDKLTSGWVPTTYLTFAAVGASGVLLNALLLRGLSETGLTFAVRQTIAGAVVIGCNFLLNNSVTFRLRRLRNRQRLIGFCMFFGACAVGLMLNVRLTELLNNGGLNASAAAAAGILAGSAWNYLVASLFVWRIARRAPAHREVESLQSQETADMTASLRRLDQQLKQPIGSPKPETIAHSRD